MNKALMTLACLILISVLTGCNLAVAPAATPTLMPTPEPTDTSIPTPTVIVPSPTFTTVAPVLLPTLTSTMPVPPTSIPSPVTTLLPAIIPGLPSGPYGVILIASGDVLNVHSGPGVAYPVVSSFNATATTVMRTGSSATVGTDPWVEVQKPGGGTGWVNSSFLTEYVTPVTFCAAGSVITLLSNLDAALTTNNGVLLSSLVSPKHGMGVYLWRYGNPITFMPNDARWVFDSTFTHNWGAAPASGLDTVGSFHVSVLPYLQEVFNAANTLTCDSLGSAPSYGGEPWPLLFSNVNFYTVFKPGTPGVDLDFRFFLVGVEFVQGQPYVFALIHFAWEP